MTKNGILIMAYGSPDKEEEVEAYYTHIRGGRKPTDAETENLKAEIQIDWRKVSSPENHKFHRKKT